MTWPASGGPQTPIRDSQRSHFSGPSGGQVIFLDGVSVDFGGFKALESIQVSVRAGELLFITGPSGAGKSSLLRVISGELVPTTGRRVGPSRDQLFAGQVFQDLKLLAGETVEENLLWAYDSEAWDNFKSFSSQLKDLSKFLEFEHQLSCPVGKVNGGLRQKVALARAILSKPDMLLLDEPTAHLDIRNAQQIFEVVNFYNSKRALTVVWASHDRELVRKFNGRIIHLEKGRLVYSGHACFI